MNVRLHRPRPALGAWLLGAAAALALPAAAQLQAAATATPAPAGDGPATQAQLMRNASAWAQRGRNDLARQSVEKLLALNPRSPQALALLGSIALEQGKAEEAQRLLQQLRHEFPGHPSTAGLGALVRAYGPEQQTLARMRLLARAGRTQEAADVARELFPEGPPGVGTVGLEYARLVPAAPGGTAAALPAPATAPAASAHASPSAPRPRAPDAPPPASAPDPGSLALEAARRALDAQDLALAQQQLQTALLHRPQDPDNLGTLGLLRLRQGRHSQARELFEQAHRLSGAQKWLDLQDTARFWGALAATDEAARQGELPKALELAQEALRLQPSHPRALTTLAELRERAGDADAALALYDQVLQREPGDESALRAAVRLLLARGRQQEALQRLEAARQGASVQPETVGALHAELLSALAQEHSKAGRAQQAEAQLRAALELQSRDPWLRHRLARVLLQLGRSAAAVQVMDEGVQLQPQEADMRYARALIRSATDDDAGARDDLEAISPEQRSDGMRSLLRSAEGRALVQQAAAPGADAAALLARAEQQAGDDSALLMGVANGWLRLEQADQAVAVLDRLAKRVRPLPAEAALDRAALLSRLRLDDRVGVLLGPLLDRPDWSDAQAGRLLEIQASHLARRIEAAMAGGDTARAQRLAGSALLAHPGLPAAQRSAARGLLLLAAQDWAGAARELAQALAGNPDGNPEAQAEVRMGLAQALARSGQPAQAREQAAGLARHLAADDRSQQLALLRLWQRLDGRDEARALAGQLLQRYPGDTGALLHAARMEQSQDRYAQALAHYQQARAAEPPEPQTRAAIEQNIRDIEARRQSWVEAGAVRVGKTAQPGVSTLRGWELPAVAWMPRGYDGHHFLHVDQVRLDAGALPAAASQAASYGTVAAWPAAQYPAQPGVPGASGVNVGVGYRGRGLEWDVGLTGIGFPVTNLVGGLAYGQWSEDFSYRVELSRRPLTGSLLSYAGVRDPITGETWGGVTATGVSGRVSRPWAGNSTSLSAGYAVLQGRNVRDNTRLQVRAAIDRDLWRDERQSLNAGAAVSLWRYGRDLSEYSWGHGGDYSPRKYASLSLPLEWGGRQGALSWQVRGALSLSRSSSPASDYYPGQPQLQAQARALGFDPVYAAGGSTGFGRSLRAAVEYQFAPGGAVGALLSMDRSAYYAPTQLTMYLRWLLEPVRALQPDRPRPLQPYSDF